jgi:hypothetical protein
VILASKWVDNEGGDLVHEPDKKIGIVFMHLRLSLVLYHYVLPIPIGLSSCIAVISHKLIELFFSKQPDVCLCLKHKHRTHIGILQTGGEHASYLNKR